MIKIYKSSIENDGLLTNINNIEPGCWINLVAPSKEELLIISKKTGVPLNFLQAPLDDEETSRIDIEDDVLLILVDIPFTEVEENSLTYDTYPLGIIHTKNEIITVCLKNSKLINDFSLNKVKSFYSFKKSRFILQILNRVSTYYLIYLRQIDKKSLMLEKRLHKSMKNRELVHLHSLQKSLVYFSTSLKANETTLEKMLKLDIIQKYEQDKDILEDVIIENKQAIEMTHIYSNILNNTMSFFSSVISNNFNSVAKILTSATMILSLFTIVSGIYGMNVSLPFSDNPNTFYFLMGGTILVSAALAYYLHKKDMFL
ncbi:MAG: magnesium transporter CorA family protein [Sarcina sp.]